jgi:hypothetical protein
MVDKGCQRRGFYKIKSKAPKAWPRAKVRQHREGRGLKRG